MFNTLRPIRPPLPTTSRITRITTTTPSPINITIRFSHTTPTSSPSENQRQGERQGRLPAAYYRGGTSRAVIFQAKDLPRYRGDWAPIFRSVLGSPDVYGRQLDGLGGGISSLSKVCIVGPHEGKQSATGPGPATVENNDSTSTRDASTTKTSTSSTTSTDGDEITPDVDYTFAAVGVRNDTVDYSSNCGNMSAAIGPFAVDSGLIRSPWIVQKDGEDGMRYAVVHIHNTNTGKIIRSTFPLVEQDAEAEAEEKTKAEGVSSEATAEPPNGKRGKIHKEEAAVAGPLCIAGVSGTGAPIRLDFLNPAGSKTGKMLPTGSAIDDFELPHTPAHPAPGGGPPKIRATCIDVGNPCVFVSALEILRDGSAFSNNNNVLMPDDIEDDVELMKRLDAVRRMAAVRMGIAEDLQSVPESVPKIALVWTPRYLRGRNMEGMLREQGQICVRALSVGQAHKAVPVTVALALAAASKIPGSIVHQCVMRGEEQVHLDEGLTISHPTGLVQVDTEWDTEGKLKSAGLYSTARRLMEGTVFYREGEQR